MSPEYPLLEAGTLWRVVSYDRGQIVTPGTRYWHSNKDRPKGQIGFQYTVSGTVQYHDSTGTYPVTAGHAFLHAFNDDSTYYLSPENTETYVCDWITFMGAGMGEHWSVLRKGHG